MKNKEVWIITKNWSEGFDTVVAIYYSENLARTMYEVLIKHATESSYHLATKEVIDHL